VHHDREIGRRHLGFGRPQEFDGQPVGLVVPEAARPLDGPLSPVSTIRRRNGALLSTRRPAR